jgi:serine/threonine-protein kinase
MPICPSCLSEVSGGQAFCGGCGAAIHATSTPTETLDDRAEKVGRVAPEASRFLPGTVLAKRYRIIGLLGRGGMGEVYRADDLKLGQPVALKFLSRHLQRDSQRLDRLLNEVRLARQVSHPNVCRVYDVGEAEGQHFLTMEHVDGENLASLLRRIGRLPGDKGVEVARQLCAGLAAVHDQGILHRDLKPANVMIDGRGRARITDFGLASIADRIDPGDLLAGTPAYMAPEQLAGRECTVASDLYALGLVFHELFTGRSVFSARARGDIARQPVGSTPAGPSNLPTDLDPAVERVIDRCLEVDPLARPRSALAVGAALPGGDPLAAILAAGETPSPEMIAAMGAAQALPPARSLLLGLTAFGIFVAGISLAGRFGIHGQLPLDKPPEVLVDRAQAIVKQLGYTEPASARPADTALGYSFDADEYERIRAGRDPERLRNPSGSVVTFWYRQSPRTLQPESGARVSLWDPFPRTTGELVVSLRMDGSLETFVAVPRRFRSTTDSTTAIDWALPFELAGLKLADHDTDEPRYQRFLQSRQIAAWVPRDTAVGHRVEAGANEGRLSLFAILDRKTAERLAAGPGEVSSSDLDVISTALLIVLVVSAFIARVNMRRGRADVRSALRLGVFMAGVSVVSSTLVSSSLLNPEAVAEAIFTGVLSTLVYLAVEPHVRRIWPTMLVSWSRLMGRSVTGARDPLVGRAILAGVLVGASLLILEVIGLAITASRQGVPGFFDLRGIQALPGQREAWSLALERVTWAVFEALSLTFLMVIARLVLRRPAPSAVLAAVLWFVPDIVSMLDSGRTPASLIVEAAFLLTIVTVLMLVLLRWGLVGAIATSLTMYLGALAPTSDWSAWHAKPGIVCSLLIAALVAYGCWAATSGHRYRAVLGGPRSLNAGHTPELR